jgi:hypothetical protein
LAILFTLDFTTFSSTTASAACSLDSNCQPYTDLTGDNLTYTVKCQQTAEIVEQLNQDYKTQCKTSWFQKVGNIATLGGMSGCAAGVTISALCAIPTAGGCLAATAPYTIGICAGTVAVGIPTLTGCALINPNDGYSKGACIAVPQKSNTPLDIASFLESIGNLIKITGNPATDGLIIIIGGFLLIMIIMNMGKK